jgi:hypothetical protein
MMSDGILTFEDGVISLGGTAVPGILKSATIFGQVQFDESDQDGRSGTVKVPMGWTDADITLVVELITESGSTCYDKLAAVSATFKGTDRLGNPQVYDVSGSHVAARGIDQVVFAGLTSQETDMDDVILATLGFVEHIPPVTQVEERLSGGAGDAASAPAADTADPEPDKTIMVDLS